MINALRASLALIRGFVHHLHEDLVDDVLRLIGVAVGMAQQAGGDTEHGLAVTW